jgi:hypothetical protein
MKIIKLTACLVSLLLALGLFLAFDALAQEPTAEPPEAETPVEIGGLGLANPPPAGFSVLYMFTGASNDNDNTNGVGDQLATSVHCTNYDTQAITLTLQFFSTSGGAVDSFSDSLASNETGTYSTQNTFFNETPLTTNYFEQGSGRILATSPKLICTAQLLESGSITPTFMVKLPLFDAAGNPVGGSGTVYLPVILKGS